MDADTARGRLASAKVGRLATVTASNRAHLVPCCFTLDGEALYTAVDAKPKSTRTLQRIDNIMANGSASLLADHYEDDWSKLWWVRVDGTGRIVDDAVERQHALELLATKYEQYRVTPPPGPVIAIAIDQWRMWP